MWKLRYKEKRLDEIIFHKMKQHMDQRSLETFSDIAYQCLQKYREKRPNMSDIVEKLQIALQFQETSEQVEPSILDFEEVIKTAVPPLVYRSISDLLMLLSKGIIIEGGNTRFYINNEREHCGMISAAECIKPIDCPWYKYQFHVRNNSRFKSGFFISAKCKKFKTHVGPHFLSPHITYTVNLVFNCDYLRGIGIHNNNDHVTSYNYGPTNDLFSISYTLAGETKSSTLYFVDKREDRYFTAELYQFTSNNIFEDLEITFESTHSLFVHGIEFQPVERVENGGLEDQEVDIQNISHPDTYWEQKLPSDYEDIIMLSVNKLQWKTKKELYSIFCKGFLTNKGEEWFSLAKNGKKCHMLSARLAFQNPEWSWGSSPMSSFAYESTTGFEQVAFDPRGSFCMKCSSKILSPQTKYGSFLVYKIQVAHPGFEHPVKVSYRSTLKKVFSHPWNIYLLSPKTPIIRPVYQHTHNPLNRPKRKGFPQQRNDGWMEVQVVEFETGTTMKRISKKLLLTFFNMKLQKGLIVKGIEFKPV